MIPQEIYEELKDYYDPDEFFDEFALVPDPLYSESGMWREFRDGSRMEISYTDYAKIEGFKLFIPSDKGRIEIKTRYGFVVDPYDYPDRNIAQEELSECFADKAGVLSNLDGVSFSWRSDGNHISAWCERQDSIPLSETTFDVITDEIERQRVFLFDNCAKELVKCKTKRNT